MTNEHTTVSYVFLRVIVCSLVMWHCVAHNEAVTAYEWCVRNRRMRTATQFLTTVRVVVVIVIVVVIVVIGHLVLYCVML